MATIHDKVNALNFTAQTTKTPEQIAQLLSDAAEIGAAVGGKIAITQAGPGAYRGSVKNFVRVEHAQFTVKLSEAAGGAGHDVRFSIDDYLRTRDTVAFIPVSPWSAPAYKPLRAFAERLQSGL
ncbi:MAG: hypothetical protein ACTH30_15135 [Leucobacter sp.]